MRQRLPTITRRQQRGGPFDLFGEIPVLTTDIDLWMHAIAPRISAWRRDWYVKHWDIPEKIRQAKLTGAWPPSSA